MVDIERVREQRLYGGVYLLVSPADIVLLPLAQAVWPAKPNQSQAAEVTAQLTAYAERMRFPLLTAELEAVARDRLPEGQPLRRWGLGS